MLFRRRPRGDLGDQAQEMPGQWQLRLVEDVDIPGWVHLPDQLGPADRRAFVDEVVIALKDLIGDQQPDGTRKQVLYTLIRRGLLKVDEADHNRLNEMPLGYWEELDNVDERPTPLAAFVGPGSAPRLRPPPTSLQHPIPE